MKFDVSFEIDLELAKEQIVKEIKEYEDKTDTTEKVQILIKLHFVKSLIEKLEVKNDLLNQCNLKIDFLERRRDSLSKSFIKQYDKNKILKTENEKLCNCINELQSKLDNMEQHTAILNKEKEEIKGLLKLKTKEVEKLKVEIDVLKSQMEEDEILSEIF